ncbi:polysaccharide biosynthesis tyrosine autokinase [Zavarzinella formosa]|uniref:polysaccharide biosynthesis tyrosine autokinase n=1 Tax=Zavarzinella formosa TaxID=360055 RepID=UPI000497B3A0|nr:tyrosine-protein kinase domain-containing protein [Zavarzinella formosa]
MGTVTLHQKGVPSSGTPSASSVTVLSLLTCVRRRWKQALVLGTLLGIMAFAFVWMFLPPSRPYAYTKLYFPAKPVGSVDHPDPPVNQQTQKELITSRIVLKAVANDSVIAALPSIVEKNDPLAWLLREVTVDFPSGSEICKISITEDRAEDAKLIVDKIAAVYLSKMGTESIENRKTHMAKLQEMVEAAKKDLNGEVDASRSGVNGGFSSSTPEVMAQRQQMINNQIIQIDSDLLKIRGLIEQYKSEEKRLAARLQKVPIELTKAEFDPLFAQNPNANRLKSLRDELSSDYELKLTGLGPENPTMIALKNRIDTFDARLETLSKELKTTIAVGFQEKLTDDLRKTRDELSRLQFEEKAKMNDVVHKQTEFEKLKDATSNAGRFRPGLAAKGTRLEELQTKLSKLEAEMTAPVSARLLEEEAVIVRPNDASRRMKMSVVAAIVCFGAMFVFLGFLEFRAHRVSNPQEASHIGLRLVGTLPNHTPGANDVHLESLVNEAMDSTRTVFLHSAMINNLRTVLVTSAVGGEGKTSLSTRLASSLARSGRRTLLIDGDLRNPSIHKYLAGQPTVGACEVLRGQLPVSEAIVAATTENLWVLPAGKCDKFAIQALSQDGFAKILVEANSHDFDFILIDSAPILPVADTLLIAKNVDGVLLSMMVDVSQVERVNVACQKLAALDIPLLGTVVQGTRSDTYGYGPEYVAPATA